MAKIKQTTKTTSNGVTTVKTKVTDTSTDANATYIYQNTGESIVDKEIPIDPITPKDELISEDYIQKVITSDMLSLEMAPGKIPLSDPISGRLRPSWLTIPETSGDHIVFASDEQARDNTNVINAVNPRGVYQSILANTKEASGDIKGVVQLATSATLNSTTINSDTLAVTPAAIKKYILQNYGPTTFANATTVSGIVDIAKTTNDIQLQSQNYNYMDQAINTYDLYRFISYNSLVLNDTNNILFNQRDMTPTKTTSTEIGSIKVDRTNKKMTSSIKNGSKTYTATILDGSGNTELPGKLTAKIGVFTTETNGDVIDLPNVNVERGNVSALTTDRHRHISWKDKNGLNLGEVLCVTKKSDGQNSMIMRAFANTTTDKSAEIGINMSADGSTVKAYAPTPKTDEIGTNIATTEWVQNYTTGGSGSGFLPLTGGTMSGPINVKASYVNAESGKTIELTSPAIRFNSSGTSNGNNVAFGGTSAGIFGSGEATTHQLDELENVESEDLYLVSDANIRFKVSPNAWNKVKELVIDKSTGNIVTPYSIVLDGTHGSTNARAIHITGENQSHAVAIQDTSFTKGTAPKSKKTIESFATFGSDKSDGNKVVSSIYTTVDKENTTTLVLEATNASKDNARDSALIQLSTDKDGNKSTTFNHPIKSAQTGTWWVDISNYKAILQSTVTSGAYGWLNGFTKDYKVLLGAYPGSSNLIYLSSYTKEKAAGRTNATTAATAEENTATATLSWNAENGKLTTNIFKGSLEGNASSATQVNNSLTFSTTASASSDVTYNGSAAKSINQIYKSVISDSATSANKVKNALTIKTPVGSYDETKVVFDGSSATEVTIANTSKVLSANTTIYVSATGTGDGSTAAKAMSVADMWKYLAAVKMAKDSDLYSLTICFVPKASSASYGNMSFDTQKMPGVKNLTLTTSTGVATTLQNYTTNAPVFGNLTFRGPIVATVKNIHCTGEILSTQNAIVYLNTYIGASKFRADTWAYMGFQNGIYNIVNNFVNYLFISQYNSRMEITTSTMNFNFKEQCWYYSGIFYAAYYGRLYIRYDRSKYTGTKPVVISTLSSSTAFNGTSSTPVGTAAKVVSDVKKTENNVTTNFTSASLVNGAVVFVKFTNGNTAAKPTLNVNGTGAKPIYFGSTNIPANYINKSFSYKFTYNSSLGAWVCNNTVNSLESVTGTGSLDYNGNYNTTYNDSSWNWTGFTRNWNYGSHVSNYIASPIVYGSIRCNAVYTTGASSYTSNLLAFNSCNDAYGNNVALGGGANTIVGSGESYANQLNALAGISNEDLYLTSDSSMYFKVNANTWSNAKTVTLKYDTSDSNNPVVHLLGLDKVTATTFAGTATKVSKNLKIKTSSSGYTEYNGSAEKTIDKVYAAATADSATNLGSDAITEILKKIYPVGSIYCNYSDNTNPKTLLGFGTWKAIEGRFIIGVDKTYTVGTGGSSSVSLTVDNLPSHTHGMDHKHNRGNMNITGTFSGVGQTYNSPRPTLTGAFYVVNKTDTPSEGVEIKNDGGARDDYFGFDASKSWTGFTSSPYTTSSTDSKLTAKTTTDAAGNSTPTAISIIPPYRAVYMWYRSA